MTMNNAGSCTSTSSTSATFTPPPSGRWWRGSLGLSSTGSAVLPLIGVGAITVILGVFTLGPALVFAYRAVKALAPVSGTEEPRKRVNA